MQAHMLGDTTLLSKHLRGHKSSFYVRITTPDGSKEKELIKKSHRDIKEVEVEE